MLSADFWSETTLSTFTNRMISLSIAAIGALAPGHSSASIPLSQDEIAIYETVLTSWSSGNSGQQLVDYHLDAPPVASDPALLNCTKGLRFPEDTQRVRDQKTLVGVHFKGDTIELTDGSNWNPDDPGAAITNGKSVEAAVSEGIGHSLISFSQAAFSHDGKDALITFSMVCGSLCGSGSTIHLHKTGTQWHVVNRCRGWIS
jgi:hypothetical protein